VRFKFLFLCLLISSCSKTISPLDLDVGDCFIDLSSEELLYGESQDVDYVEVVDCFEPHNYEIVAKFQSVPESYRNSENPIDDVCFDHLVEYIESIYPNADYLTLIEIYEKFDAKYTPIMHFNTIGDTLKPDLNKEFNCGVMSKNSLIFNNFKKDIEKN